MKRAVVLAWLICCTGGPAMPGAHAEAPKPNRSVLAEVKELDKPVSYTETKIPLGELVQKVAKETGASLTAAREVADEPVAVIVKDLEARQLLEQLADLLDYRWTRKTAGVTSFRTSRVREKTPAPPESL